MRMILKTTIREISDLCHHLAGSPYADKNNFRNLQLKVISGISLFPNKFYS